MADEVDQAGVLNDFFFKVAQRNRHAFAPVIKATGKCLYCDDSVLNGNRWCDVRCRDAWEREQKRR